ncbi:MAG: ATP-dependent DNA helicase RecG [Nannocystaceae bacterium]
MHRGLWEKLQLALREAARGQFAAIEEDRVVAQIQSAVQAFGGDTPVSGTAEFGSWREEVLRLAGMGRHDRSRVVAVGLRLCMARAQQRAHAPTKPSRPARRKGAARGRPNKTDPAKRAHAVERPAARDAGALTDLVGVGPKTAQRLGSKGFETIEDLAYLIPRGYRDLRLRHRFEQVSEGEVAVGEANIEAFRQGWFGGRYRARMDVVQEHEGAPAVQLRWFHPVGGLVERVETGKRVLVVGLVKTFRGSLTIVHPELHNLEAGSLGISVVYPSVEGVGARTLARLCRASVARLRARDTAEFIPHDLLRLRALPSQIEALESLHEPAGDLSTDAVDALAQARSCGHRRLAYEELFLMQLILLRRRCTHQAQACAVASLPDSSFDQEQLRACLPFEPTGAQWRVLREVQRDLSRDKPMLRLLQGDVGSGKTVIAFSAALALAHAGSQVAMMAPTEILAEQHLRTLCPWCEQAGLRIALLTGTTGRAQRSSLLALLAAGKIDLLIGTHALLVGDVAFASLGLVVVDEQHRFGVEQRTLLREKGQTPHLLVMTATPIPRSLALTAFGELDVSVIDELPPGRRPCETSVFAGRQSLVPARAKLCSLVRGGARAYVVCPLVEASDSINVSDVEATAVAFRELLPGHRVGVVHGRMTAADKEKILRAFRGGELAVLVATTVIEVGLDVPEATAILIEHAERFGLAQLHQLRGRVGRGERASQCLLHTANPRTSEAGERLGILAKHADGFVVAERDLEIRGPGEVFGIQQSGAPRLRFARFNAGGLVLLQTARDDAAALLEEDAELRAHPELRAALERELARRAVFAGESG